METKDTRAGGTTGDDNPWRIAKGEKSPRIFADEGPGTKWGCLGSVALLIAVASGGVAFCNHETAERARVDALQKAEEAKEEEARYQDRVRSGQVCADGPNDLTRRSN
jgi:hypothetical protein